MRHVHDIHAYRSAEKTGQWLTMSEAAATLNVINHRIRRLIEDGALAAQQLCQARRSRYAPATSIVIGGRLLQSRELLARIASTRTSRSQ